MNIFDVLYARQTGKTRPRAKITDNLLGLALAGGGYEEKTIDFTPVISISDAKAGNALDYQCKITAKQAGTGDPSPTNIRDLNGWTQAQIKRRNKNLLLASDFLADIVASTTGATVSGTKITLPNGSSNVKTNADDRARIMEGDFKENTQYSIFVKQDDSTQAVRGLFTVYYTDGTNQHMYNNTYDSTRRYWKIITPANKTVERLLINCDSTDPICYDTEKCGIFEGNVSYDDFVKSEGEDITLSFGTTIYNGQGDVTTGGFTATHTAEVYDGTEEGWTELTGGRGYYLHFSEAKDIYSREEILKCSCLIGTNAGSSTSMPLNSIMLNASKINLLCRVDTETDFPTLDSWKAFLSQNPMTVLFPLTEPAEITLTPTDIVLAEGANTIWADTGDSKLTYLAKKG